MFRRNHVILQAFVFGLTVAISSGEPNFCGMKDPDPEKTCVSLRLPWQEEPIYFCTDKGSFRYRNQCASAGNAMHCGNQWSRETLLLATPWDCCPISSIPDNCVNAQCPPAPFNRTCRSIPPASDKPWDCCPKYQCDEAGGPRKDCHYKQLEPGCNTPPKGKTNCVGFYDNHGCCTQYQCDGEGKPGMCPMQMQAMKYSGKGMMTPATQTMGMGMAAPKQDQAVMMKTTGARQKRRTEKRMAVAPSHNGDHNTDLKMAPAGHANMDHSAPPMSPPAGPGAMISQEKHSYSIAVEPYPGMPHPPMHMHLPCVGDYNCPGTMKCCSSDINVYSDGSALIRNIHATHGLCVEPMTM